MTAQLAESKSRDADTAARPRVAFPELTRDEVFMIGTRRLWLRWPRLDDVEALARIGGDARVAARSATWPEDCSSDFARTRIAKARAENAAGTGFAFVIAERTAWSEAIGLMGFNIVAGGGDLVASGGYHLAPEHWGKGYASEALGGIVPMIRLLTRIRALKASVMPHNTASARVLQKAGFRKVGAGLMHTDVRGDFAVDHYERRLLGPGANATVPSPLPGASR